jgi:Tol biopolymer transport system component
LRASSAAFSPDGRWIAYASAESGQLQVYVRPFPGLEGRSQVSTGFGQFPAWSRNGRELFFQSLDFHIMVSEYTANGDSFEAGTPRQWSDVQLSNLIGGPTFDLAPTAGAWSRP